MQPIKSNGPISHFKVSNSSLNVLDLKSPKPQQKTLECVKECEIEWFNKIHESGVEIMLPLRTVSPNQFEPWQKRHKREKAQKRAVMFAMIPIKDHLQTPCKIKFTRYAPKWLDAHDNLPMSMKKILDQTCAEITNDFVPGRADSYDCFTFEFDQVKSKQYGVKIEIKWQ